MTRPTDGCLKHAGRPKAASSGYTIFLMEELGDARLNCAKLTRALDEARKLVEKSDHRDHIFEIAGHLLHSIPELTFKLEKSLQAVALAADRLDYEEIKQDLKPDKVEELEKVLKDVRIRNVQHRSGGPMNPQLAAEALRKLAAETRESGQLPVADVLDLISQLESKERTASDLGATADTLENMARSLTAPSSGAPKRTHLAASLKKLLVEDAISADFGKSADQVPASALGVTETIRTYAVQAGRSAAAGRWKYALLTYMAVVEHISELAEGLGGSPELAVKADQFNRGLRQVMQSLHGQPEVQSELAVMASDEEKESRFEEGKPADPTENMSPEDAKKWKEEHAKNKDKFKKEAWKVDAVNLRTRPLGQGMDKGTLVAALFEGANELFEARAKTRDIQQALQDAKEGYAARIGPLAMLDHSIWQLADVVKKAAYEWDRQTGDVARDFENLARKMKAAKPALYASDEEKESRFEEGKPADPTENMSPEDAKKWKENTEEHKDKFKAADWKTAKLQKRQEAILKKYLDSAGSRAVMFFDELPPRVQDELRRVKDQETLHMDVDRWLGDNNNPHLRTGW